MRKLALLALLPSLALAQVTTAPKGQVCNATGKCADVTLGKLGIYTDATQSSTAIKPPASAVPTSCMVNATTGTAQCSAAPGTGLYFYITSVMFSNGDTAQNIQIVQGTGSNCGTGQTVVVPSVFLPANSGGVLPFPISTPLKGTAANQQLCCKPSGTSAFSCLITYYVAS